MKPKGPSQGGIITSIKTLGSKHVVTHGLIIGDKACSVDISSATEAEKDHIIHGDEAKPGGGKITCDGTG